MDGQSGVSHDGEGYDVSVVPVSQSEVEKEESAMESQAQVILSRIHRLQGRQCQRHVQKHVQAFVRQEQITTGVGCQAVRLNTKDRPGGGLNGRYLNAKHISEEKLIHYHGNMKNLSSSKLVNLVKKLDPSSYKEGTLSDGSPSRMVADNMASCPPTLVKTATRPSLDHVSPGSQEAHYHNDRHQHQSPSAAIRTSSNLQMNLNALSPEQQQQQNRSISIDCTVGTLKHNLHHLETDYDSDATDSSSGGDSCDESSFPHHFNSSASSLPLNGFASNNSSPSTPSTFSRKHNSSSLSSTSQLKESVSWKWVGERGAIAARWMWLFAQVADLEFKIRQQNEMYRTLRSSKGPIILEASASESSCMESSGKEAESSCLENSGKEPEGNDGTSQCVRTMPVRPLRKRRLVRSAVALAGATRKAARYSTLQCSCSSLPPFVSPCLVCNGRYSYVQVIDTDCMPQSERIALLDPSYHPVISLPNQIPLGLHFAKFLKREIVQRSPSKNQLKNESKRKNVSDFHSSKLLKEERTKNNVKKSQAVISSNKLKKKYDSSTKRKMSQNSFDQGGSGKRSKGKGGGKGKRERHESSSNGSLEAGEVTTQAVVDSNAAPRRRRSELQHAFDINNIVIPYSIASTTRVEKLQYKEILTPKWREVDFDSELPPLTPSCKANESDQPIDGLLEDLSDVTFIERHRKCEIEERKRFLTFLTPASGTPGAHRGRGMARCDSKTEPSAGNGFGLVEPESIMNDQNNTSGFEDSLVTSNNNSMKHPLKTNHVDPQVHGTPARAFERRRTTSSSRREDSIDDDQQTEVAPYEKRTFPLPESDLALLVEPDEPVPVQSNGSTVKESLPREVKRDFPASPVKEVTFCHPPHNDTSLPATPRSDKSLSVSVSGLSASPTSETDPEETEDPEWAPEVA